jgi:hypothetical protein
VQGDKLKARLKDVNNFLEDLPKNMEEKFRESTPIRTGNARNSTRLKGDDINADYHYAQRLQNGASRQAPEGMTKPTIDWVRKELRDL